MSLVSLAAIYFVLWWLVLFAVLPWGMRTQEEAGEVVLGTAHSAPVRPRLLRTVVATSIVTGLIVGLMWLAVAVYGLSVWTITDWFDPRR